MGHSEYAYFDWCCSQQKPLSASVDVGHLYSVTVLVLKSWREVSVLFAFIAWVTQNMLALMAVAASRSIFQPVSMYTVFTLLVLKPWHEVSVFFAFIVWVTQNMLALMAVATSRSIFQPMSMHAIVTLLVLKSWCEVSVLFTFIEWVTWNMLALMAVAASRSIFQPDVCCLYSVSPKVLAWSFSALCHHLMSHSEYACIDGCCSQQKHLSARCILSLLC